MNLYPIPRITTFAYRIRRFSEVVSWGNCRKLTARCGDAEVGSGTSRTETVGNSSFAYELVKVFEVGHFWVAEA